MVVHDKSRNALDWSAITHCVLTGFTRAKPSPWFLNLMLNSIHVYVQLAFKKSLHYFKTDCYLESKDLSSVIISRFYTFPEQSFALLTKHITGTITNFSSLMPKQNK